MARNDGAHAVYKEMLNKRDKMSILLQIKR